MYWKLEALTAARTPITQIIEGHLEDIKLQAAINDLEILSLRPDAWALAKSFFYNRRLPVSMLAVFFNDFANMQRCGLSVHEAINTLQETTSHKALKAALAQISNFINDGRSLQEAFENTRIFPKMVAVTLSAAEKTGHIPELCDVLSGYCRFKSDNQKKVVQSMVYPFVVFCLLSGVSVFISATLVPQLKTFLPQEAYHNGSAWMLIGYAGFIKAYGGMVLLFLGGAVFFIKYFWGTYREKWMEIILRIPIVGGVIKNMELAALFQNMYVYQKSGINIIETINNIHQAGQTHITHKLLLIRDQIFKGVSLADAFRQDTFFPPFVYQNLTKGQVSGYLPQYFQRLTQYYDIKTKESIAVMIAMVEPMLMVMAAAFLLMIVFAFILPIYTNMPHMGV